MLLERLPRHGYIQVGIEGQPFEGFLDDNGKACACMLLGALPPRIPGACGPRRFCDGPQEHHDHGLCGRDCLHAPGCGDGLVPGAAGLSLKGTPTTVSLPCSIALGYTPPALTVP